MYFKYSICFLKKKQEKYIQRCVIRLELGAYHIICAVDTHTFKTSKNKFGKSV